MFFLAFSSGVFLQKFQNQTREQKSFVEIKPVLVDEHVKI